MFYIISIIITLLSNFVTNKLMNRKIENMGYVAKSKRTTKTSLAISFALNFIPYFNIILTVLNAILCVVAVNYDKLFLEITKDKRHNSDDVIASCKRNLIKNDVLKDAMILDGASEKEIKEEFKKIKNYANFATKEKGWLGYYTETSPLYTEADFNKAKAIEAAKNFLNEIETNVNLTNKQKQKILALCKKDFLNNIKGKENRTNKSTNKILKLAKND